MNRNVLKLAILAAAFAANTACSSAQGDDLNETNVVKQKMTQSHKDSHNHGKYQKPSAAIHFDIDHSGVTPMGVSDIVTLRVRDDYPGAVITYKVLTSEGLTYFGSREISMPSTSLAGIHSTAPSDVELNANLMSLQIQPISEGAHKLTVIATARLADGQSIVRSQTIPIYTGDEFKPSKEDTLNSQKSKNAPLVSNGVIIMDAEETIED